MNFESKSCIQALNVVKVTPGWGFLEQVLPVISALAKRGHAIEIWVPEPWITHLVGVRDPTGRDLEKLGATFIAPNGLRGLIKRKNFTAFVYRNRVTSIILKFAGLLGLRELCYPSGSKYAHRPDQHLRVFADCYFYHDESDLTPGQRLLRDSDLDVPHVSFYHGNFDPLTYEVPNALPHQIDIHCYYEDQLKRLQALADHHKRRVLSSILPRLAEQLEFQCAVRPEARTLWFFSRPPGLPSGVQWRTKRETLKWISMIALEHGLDVVIQLHPSEKKREFLKTAKLAELKNFSFGKLEWHEGREHSNLARGPLFAVSNFVGLVPNLVQSGIPCIELWPEGFEDYTLERGKHRFDFSQRGMSLAVSDLDGFRNTVRLILNGDFSLLERQREAVNGTFLGSGLSLTDLVDIVSRTT